MCPLCLESFVKQKMLGRIIITSKCCNTRFCRDCVATSISMNGPQCPICNVDEMRKQAILSIAAAEKKKEQLLFLLVQQQQQEHKKNQGIKSLDDHQPSKKRKIEKYDDANVDINKGHDCHDSTKLGASSTKNFQEEGKNQENKSFQGRDNDENPDKTQSTESIESNMENMIRGQRKILQKILDLSSSDTSKNGFRLSESEQSLATVFTYAVITQYTPAKLTEKDRIGKRANLKIGFAGIKCLHCSSATGKNSIFLQGRYFPSSIKTMCDTKKTLFALYSHLMKCANVPTELKNKFVVLRKHHDVEKKRLGYGNLKSFFSEIWNILHGEHPDGVLGSKEQSNVVAHLNIGDTTKEQSNEQPEYDDGNPKADIKEQSNGEDESKVDGTKEMSMKSQFISSSSNKESVEAVVA